MPYYHIAAPDGDYAVAAVNAVEAIRALGGGRVQRVLTSQETVEHGVPNMAYGEYAPLAERDPRRIPDTRGSLNAAALHERTGRGR